MKILLALFFSMPAFPAVLMLDFNNGPKETEACTSADPDNVFVVNEKTMKKNYVDKAVVEEAITNMERANKPIDTLVISGHHGVNGEFFGGQDGKNGMLAKELREICQSPRHAKTARSLRNIVLAGCYTGTVEANKKYWMRVCPNVTFTAGFPLQAPSKEKPAGHQLLREICSPEKRAAAARAGTKEALCEFYRNMPILAIVGASVANYCYGDNSYNIATNSYGRGKMCHSFDELNARCAEFDPGDKMKAQWDAFLEADIGTYYEDPPLDGADVNAPSINNPLRAYYDKVHLWRHCKDQIAANRDYEMPSPGTIIRMAKFTQIKENLNRLNRRELNDYDNRLRDLGLGRYALGDLNSLTRGQIRRKVFDAMKMLNALGDRNGANGTNTRAVWRMANGFNMTFVELASQAQRVDGKMMNCSNFNLVHSGVRNPNDKSDCIVGYEAAAAEME